MTDIVTRKLTTSIDLIDVAGNTGWVFQRSGVGVAGRGVWARVDASEVLSVVGDLGPNVIAIGARPFDHTAPWQLVIPTYQVRVDEDGNAFETVIGGDAPPSRSERSDAASFGDVRLTPLDGPKWWKNQVAHATKRIQSGCVEKIVLARAVEAVTQRPITPTTLLRRLERRFPQCFLYFVDGLVGASPELLVERTGLSVRSQPMAGTIRHVDDAHENQKLIATLKASPTYRHEHQVTIDMVRDTLLNYASFIDFEPEPSLIGLANVTHLASNVEGELSSPPASVLELQDALHPTPAVSGRPRNEALDAIAELEAHDRGRYAGTVGWVDATGDGCFAVSIRCAQIDSHDPHRAILHAGCGLVADSDPDAELAESQAKLDAMIQALRD